MATTSRKQTIGHAQVKTNTNAPGLVASARPSGLHGPEITPDYSDARNMERMARAASGIAGVMGKLAIRQADKRRDAEFLLGQQARIEAGYTDLERYQSEEGIQLSNNAVKGYNAASGKADAARDIVKLKQLQDQAGDSWQTPEQLNEVYSSVFDSTLKGNNNPEYAAAYFETMQPAEMNLRAEWQQNKWIANQHVARSDLAVAARADLQNKIDTGASSQEIHSGIREMQEMGNMMNIPNKDVQATIFDAVVEMAIANRNPQLLADDGPLSFDSSDVNDPSIRIPAMTDSPEGRAKILDARRSVQDAIDADKENQDDHAKYLTRVKYDQYAENKQYRQAIYSLDEDVKAGLVEPGKAAQIHKEARAAIVLQGKVDTLKSFAGTESEALAIAMADPDVREAAYEQQYKLNWKNASESGALLPSTVIQMVDSGMKYNTTDPGLKQILNQSPAQAYDTYLHIKQERPHVIGQYIKDEEKLLKLGALEFLIEEMGYPRQIAAEMVKLQMSPEGREQATKDIESSSKWHGDVADYINDEVKNEIPWWPDSDADILNLDHFNATARNLYKKLRVEYGLSHEIGMKQLGALIERNYEFIPFSEDGPGSMVYHGGRYQDTQLVKETYSWFGEGMKAKVKSTGGTPADAYYLQNNPNDPTSQRKMVMEVNEDGLPRPYVDAAGNIVYRDLPTVVAAYEKDQNQAVLKELEEERIQAQIEADARLNVGQSGGRNKANQEKADDPLGFKKGQTKAEAKFEETRRLAEEKRVTTDSFKKRTRKRKR